MSDRPETPVCTISVAVEPDVYHFTVSGGVRPVNEADRIPSLWQAGAVTLNTAVCACDATADATNRRSGNIFFIKTISNTVKDGLQ
jgi:hypothetical protein